MSTKYRVEKGRKVPGFRVYKGLKFWRVFFRVYKVLKFWSVFLGFTMV